MKPNFLTSFFLTSVHWSIQSALFLMVGFAFGQTPTADLTVHEPASVPAGATFEWHTGSSSGSSLVSSPTDVSPGLYFGFLNFGAGCFSTGSPINVITNTCPSTTFNLKLAVDTTIFPVGSTLSFHTALPVSDGNAITGTSVTEATPGTYYVSFKKTVNGSSCYSDPAPIVAILSNINCSLPIEITYFEASVNENTVDLSWQTASEINNDYFMLEKSTDGKIWTLFTKIDGAGNSFSPIDYRATDTKPGRGIVYYKLTQTDFDGHQITAPIRSVVLENTTALEAYPNPFSDWLTLESPVLNETVRLYSCTGKLVYQQVIEEAQTSLNLQFLEKGIYFLQIQNEIHKIRKE